MLCETVLPPSSFSNIEPTPTPTNLSTYTPHHLPNHLRQVTTRMFDFTFRVPFQFRNPFTNNSNLDRTAPPRLPHPAFNTRPRPIPRPEMLSRVAEIDSQPSQKRRRGWQPTDASGGVAQPQLSRSVSRGELERLGSSGCIGLADDDQGECAVLFLQPGDFLHAELFSPRAASRAHREAAHDDQTTSDCSCFYFTSTLTAASS